MMSRQRECPASPFGEKEGTSQPAVGPAPRLRESACGVAIRLRRPLHPGPEPVPGDSE